MNNNGFEGKVDIIRFNAYMIISKMVFVYYFSTSYVKVLSDKIDKKYVTVMY